METFLKSLQDSEGGRRFLLNLYWGLQDGLAVDLISELVSNAAVAVHTGKYDPFFPERGRLRSVVFGLPDRYQFKGRRPEVARGRWMTVKRGDDLAELVIQGLSDDREEAVDRFAELFPDLTAGDPLRVVPAKLLHEMAITINDRRNNISFPLGRERTGSSSPAFPGTRRRQSPSWFSRWCLFEQAFPSQPEAESAGRIRNWLGLPIDAEPLFAVRARNDIDAEQLLAHRPTVFEGFDGPFFKYPTGTAFTWAGCGSAVDLDLLQDPWDEEAMEVPIDGGPELFSQGLLFSQEIHECVYLGNATRLPYSPWGEEFHKYLIPRGRSLDEVIDELVHWLQPKTSGTAS